MIKTEAVLLQRRYRRSGTCWECGAGPARVYTEHAVICGVCWHRALLLRHVMGKL